MKRLSALLAILGLIATVLTASPASAADTESAPPDGDADSATSEEERIEGAENGTEESDGSEEEPGPSDDGDKNSGPPQILEDPAPSTTDQKEVVESKTGSYLVVLVEEPLIADTDAEDLDTPTAEARADELEAGHDEVLTAAGVEVSDKVQGFTNAVNGFAATMSHDEAVTVAAQKEVKLVIPDELHQHTTDSSAEFLGLTAEGGAYDSGLDGSGVVVGVIDSGIWPEHPSFEDTGFPEPPVVLEDTPENPACNFGNTAHNPDDAAFTCNNKLIGARQMLATYREVSGAEPDEFDSARDDDGHGTHTASTAAGNAGVEAQIFGKNYGEVSGIAPNAHVIAYKALGNGGGFTSDLVSAIDQAVADGVDVINYSVGGGPGLDGGDAIAFLFATNAGVHIATSAGNSGPDAVTIGGPADVPWVTSVGASTQERFLEGTAHLTDGGDVRGASITPPLDEKTPLVDAEAAGSDLCLPGELDEAVVAGNVVLCRRGAIARVAKSEAVFDAGGVGMILYNNDDVGDLITDNHPVPSVHVDQTEGLKVKAYIAETDSPTVTIQSGDIVSRKAPNMASFSSRGENPTAADLIKPDITAPGVQILAGASPFPDPGQVTGELFQAIAGTSMSSPHVAGVFALIDQAHPDWSPAMVKSAVMTSASTQVRDNDRTSQATPFAMGAGHLDPGNPGDQGSAFDPGLVYDAELADYAAFTCGADVGIFGDVVCDSLTATDRSFDASDLNVPSIGIAELAGSQTVTRTVTSVAEETISFRPRVEKPSGYDVTVSPTELTLAPGESASYEVTITNDGSGVPGEWSFGRLSWRGAGYSVSSPIAVRGALLSAPASVAGAGADGSETFDVTFGYDGPYTAAPHGLEASVSTTGVVAQDPDQNFDPTDGFAQTHIFDLTGAAFFRLSLTQDATEPDADLDIYVTDPAGEIVAQSTAGGTNELIELVLPEAGEWTVWVHGWQTVDGDSPYDLSTWTVSATPGGSLSVDEAPEAATIGDIGSIGISWTGLESQNYLGAVSHSDGDGIIGLTLVEVTG